MSDADPASWRSQLAALLFQRRILHLESPGVPLTLPADALATLTLAPEDAFGAASIGRRTTIPLNSTARLMWNANEGTTEISGPTIEPLYGTIAMSRGISNVNGNVLTVSFPAQEESDLLQNLAWLAGALPLFLSLRLSLYVWITQFTVAVGPTLFNYQVDASQDHFTVSTAQRNFDLFRQALADVELPAATHPRFVLSLAYFRHALKLSAIQPDRHTVLGELILNLAKSLEMLLSSDRDVARSRAAEWGFSTNEVEERIIPIYLLRNEIGIAHASSGPLTQSQIATILRFSDTALTFVGGFLRQVFEAAITSHISLPDMPVRADTTTDDLIAALAQYVDGLSSSPTTRQTV